MMHLDIFIPSRQSKCCNQLGESHEEEFNYRAAVPWYERSLLYAQKRQRLVMSSSSSPNDDTTCAKRLVSTQALQFGIGAKAFGILAQGQGELRCKFGAALFGRCGKK
jgi:hypothetical protein